MQVADEVDTCTMQTTNTQAQGTEEPEEERPACILTCSSGALNIAPNEAIRRSPSNPI